VGAVADAGKAVARGATTVFLAVAAGNAALLLLEF
jgi:hypothetical protein